MKRDVSQDVAPAIASMEALVHSWSFRYKEIFIVCGSLCKWWSSSHRTCRSKLRYMPSSSTHVWKMKKNKPATQEQALGRAYFYSTAEISTSPLPCSKRVDETVKVSVINAANIARRRVPWLVSNTPITNVIIGPDVLSPLGLHDIALLSKGYGRLNGEFDVKRFVDR